MNDIHRILSNAGHMAEVLAYIALAVVAVALVVFAARSHR